MELELIPGTVGITWAHFTSYEGRAGQGEEALVVDLEGLGFPLAGSPVAMPLRPVADGTDGGSGPAGT